MLAKQDSLLAAGAQLSGSTTATSAPPAANYGDQAPPDTDFPSTTLAAVPCSSQDFNRGAPVVSVRNKKSVKVVDPRSRNRSSPKEQDHEDDPHAVLRESGRPRLIEMQHTHTQSSTSTNSNISNTNNRSSSTTSAPFGTADDTIKVARVCHVMLPFRKAKELEQTQAPVHSKIAQRLFVTSLPAAFLVCVLFWFLVFPKQVARANEKNKSVLAEDDFLYVKVLSHGVTFALMAADACCNNQRLKLKDGVHVLTLGLCYGMFTLVAYFLTLEVSCSRVCDNAVEPESETSSCRPMTNAELEGRTVAEKSTDVRSMCNYFYGTLNWANVWSTLIMGCVFLLCFLPMLFLAFWMCILDRRWRTMVANGNAPSTAGVSEPSSPVVAAVESELEFVCARDDEMRDPHLHQDVESDAELRRPSIGTTVGAVGGNKEASSSGSKSSLTRGKSRSRSESSLSLAAGAGTAGEATTLLQDVDHDQAATSDSGSHLQKAKQEIDRSGQDQIQTSTTGRAPTRAQYSNADVHDAPILHAGTASSTTSAAVAGVPLFNRISLPLVDTIFRPSSSLGFGSSLSNRLSEDFGSFFRSGSLAIHKAESLRLYGKHGWRKALFRDGGKARSPLIFLRRLIENPREVFELDKMSHLEFLECYGGSGLACLKNTNDFDEVLDEVMKRERSSSAESDPNLDLQVVVQTSTSSSNTGEDPPSPSTAAVVFEEIGDSSVAGPAGQRGVAVSSALRSTEAVAARAPSADDRPPLPARPASPVSAQPRGSTLITSGVDFGRVNTNVFVKKRGISRARVPKKPADGCCEAVMVGSSASTGGGAEHQIQTAVTKVASGVSATSTTASWVQLQQGTSITTSHNGGNVRPAFLYLRTLFFLVALGILVISLTQWWRVASAWFCYITHWSLVLQVVYLGMAAYSTWCAQEDLRRMLLHVESASDHDEKRWTGRELQEAAAGEVEETRDVTGEPAEARAGVKTASRFHAVGALAPQPH